MKAASPLSLFLRDVFPKAGPELLRLYEAAAENSNLLHTDYYTIRDQMELSGYTTQEPLQALLLVMLLALDEGSLCVEASEASLARRLGDLIGEADARSWAASMVSSLRQPGFPELIGECVDDGKPVVIRRLGPRTYLYFQKYLKYELALQAELRKHLGSGEASHAPSQRLGARGQPLSTILKDVEDDAPLQISGKRVQLSRDQRLAIALALLRNFVIISGGPGTGKTSIVFTLLRCLVRAGVAVERIGLAAPTGRAAQRLTDAVQAGLENLKVHPAVDGPDHKLRNLAAQTLHHLLGFNPSRGIYRHHVENPLPYDVIIVDEVSMVGLVLMAHLFQAIVPTTRLILLGDKDQLPSVDAGAVLANLVPGELKPSYSVALCAQVGEFCRDMKLPPAPEPGPLQDVLVVLEENFRSQQALHEVARSVNAQQVEVVDRLTRFVLIAKGENSAAQASNSFAALDKQAGCWLLDQGQGDIQTWRRALDQWAEHHYLTPRTGGDVYCDLVAHCEFAGLDEIAPEQKTALDRLFTQLAQARVLTLVREGPWGCAGINAYLEQVLRPRLDRHGFGKVFAGLPVLITRNDYSRLLFNGDVGIALRSRGGGYRIAFHRSGGYVSFPADALPAHEPGFALTVHKSQGSEYDQVMLVLPPEGGRRLLTKELIYTGITRARQVALISSKNEVLRSAIARRVERESALLDFGGGA